MSFSLKYALNGREIKAIMMQRLIKVDGKVRTDTTYPAGFMDVISLEKTGEHFRLIYDTKGRFTVHRIQAEEAEFKLARSSVFSLARAGSHSWLRTMREREFLRSEVPCHSVVGPSFG